MTYKIINCTFIVQVNVVAVKDFFNILMNINSYLVTKSIFKGHVQTVNSMYCQIWGAKTQEHDLQNFCRVRSNHEQNKKCESWAVHSVATERWAETWVIGSDSVTARLHSFNSVICNEKSKHNNILWRQSVKIIRRHSLLK